jgi:polyisoprenoid-binding protein YceI
MILANSSIEEIALMSTITTSKTVPAGTWSADPVHSHVSFEIEYAGGSTFQGSFREFSAALDDGSLTGAARVASVDVKDEQLNDHLLSPDFFDAERHPEIAFRATELVEKEDGTVHGTGELTIKGVTKAIELAGRIGEPAVDPFGREKLGLTLEGSVDRNDFGISWNMPNQSGGNYLGDVVKLVANLVLVRQES